MVRAAEKAGRGLIRDFGEVDQLQVSRKGPGDFVGGRFKGRTDRAGRTQRVAPSSAFTGRERTPKARISLTLDRRSTRRDHEFLARIASFLRLDRPRQG